MVSQGNNNPSGYRILILLLLISGAAALMISPVSAEEGVTIFAYGDQSYYYGEEVILHGNNSISDTTYLFVTGPNLPSGGVKLTLPHEGVVGGDPRTFTVVKTRQDKTWEYTYYTANLMMDAGVFTIYAASQPTTNDLAANATSSRGSIILKRPFITAETSPATVTKGQPFTVKGIAEGIPPSVQIWIIGDNYVFNTTTTVNPDASFTFTGDTQLSGKLPTGQNYLIVQHPMADNQFDFVVSGDYVRNLKLNNGTNVFKLTGPGSLQGSDAADALIAAISDQGTKDHTLTNDTYTIVPFQVTDAGSPTPQATAVTTAPVQRTTPQHAPLQYALLGAIGVAAGIVIWKRH